MILHEYRAATVGAGEVLLGTALTLAGVALVALAERGLRAGAAKG